jgi:hypothetical protein
MDHDILRPSRPNNSDGVGGSGSETSSGLGNEDKNDSDLCPITSNSTPPPPTAAEIDRWHYHTEMKRFGDSLQAATNAVFPNERRSRYSNVSVLMISWEDEDPRLPVSLEMEKLKRVFQDLYQFHTEHWKIPDQNSHHKLAKKIVDFVEPTEQSATHLKIIYYAGHARLLDTRGLAWTRYVWR